MSILIVHFNLQLKYRNNAANVVVVFAVAYAIVKQRSKILLQCHTAGAGATVGESNNEYEYEYFAHNNNRLLYGIDDVTKAEYYSNNMSIKNAYELMRDTNHLYNICLKNTGGNIVNLHKDLKRINNKADMFIQSDKVWNR